MNPTSGWWAYSIWYMLEHNFFFRYPGIGTVLHWRDTEMKNILPTLPYFIVLLLLCSFCVILSLLGMEWYQKCVLLFCYRSPRQLLEEIVLVDDASERGESVNNV